MADFACFEAIVTLEGINPQVEVPAGIVKELGGSSAEVQLRLAGQVPIAEVEDSARLEAIGRLTPDGWFRTTLVPRSGGRTLLFLDRWMREAAGVSVGESARIRLRNDSLPREMAVPAELQTALDQSAAALDAWQRLPPSRRKEILTYLNFLKTPAARQRNVLRTVAELEAREGRS